MALLFVERSNLGKVFVAIRDNENVVRSLGIPVFMTKVLCFAVASAVAGLAGSVHAYASNVISPLDFGFMLSTFALAYLRGGEGQPLGPIIGAVLLVGIASYAQTLRRQRAHSLRPGHHCVGAVHAQGPDGPVQESLRDRMQTGSMLLTGQNLSKQFKGLLAVSGVDIRIARGDRRPIGSNGAGKSTTFNLLSGFLRPTSGSLEIAGADMSKAKPERISRQGLVRTFQHGSYLPSMSVRDNVLIGCLGGRRPTAGRKRAGTGHRAGHCAVRPGRARERHCPQPAARPAAPGEHGPWHSRRGPPAVPGRAADRLEPDRGGRDAGCLPAAQVRVRHVHSAGRGTICAR